MSDRRAVGARGAAALADDRAGEGPPLVLLHPLGADRRVWDPVVALLRLHRRVVAVDLPGFGASPPLRGVTPTPRALAEAVAGHLAATSIDRPDIAGNSLGGWVALELGLQGIARTVAAISPAGLWPEPLVPKAAIGHRLAAALQPLIGPATASRAGRRLLLGGSAAHPERIPPRAAAHLVRAYAQAPGFSAVNDAMRAGRFDHLEGVSCPVTLIWPDHDRLIRRPVQVPDRIRNVVLRDCGHVPMWDAPRELARILLEAAGCAGDAGTAAEATPGPHRLTGRAGG